MTAPDGNEPDCTDLRAHAAGIASLAPSDPERTAAERHAASCPGCAEVLREASQLWLAVDASAAPSPGPAPEVLARIRSMVLADLAPRGAAWHGVVVALALAACFAAIVFVAKEHGTGQRLWLEAGALLALGLAGAALLAREKLAKLGVIGAILGSAGFAAYAGGGSELFGLYGLRCLGTEIFASALPLGIVVVLSSRGQRRGTASELASAGALGALAGQAALHLTCHAGSQLPHLLVLHTGGVVLSALLGAALSRLPLRGTVAAHS